jgi:aryl-alcohol dehydrogenase-like predicted oxidoreductase
MNKTSSHLEIFMNDNMAHHVSHSSISTINTAVSYTSTNADTLIHISQCPRIILDSTCNLFTSTIQSPSQLLNRLKNQPIPITALDLCPRTETNIGAHHNDVRIGTKVRVLGSSIGTGKGELRSSNVRESVLRSLATTHASKMDYLIAQRVDHEVSVCEVAGGFGGLVCEGIIDAVCLGYLISVYSMKMCTDMVAVGSSAISATRSAEHHEGL